MKSEELASPWTKNRYTKTDFWALRSPPPVSEKCPTTLGTKVNQPLGKPDT